MLQTQIAQTLSKKRAGSIFTLVIQREAKTFKGSPRIEKVTKMQGMLCDYANRTPVKEGVASGIRGEVELPSHIEKSVFVEGVRFWQGSKGQIYLPVTVSGNKQEVIWLLEGRPVQKSEIEQYLLSSEKQVKPDKEELAEKGQVPFVSVKIENVIEVR